VSTPAEALTPAEKLEGRSLPNEWIVVEKITRQPGATGGFFSVGYRSNKKTVMRRF